MGALIATFLRGLFSFAGGVALTSVVDKFFPDKLPAGVAPLQSPVMDNTGKINFIKLIFIVVVGAIGMIAVKFIGKKLNIKILK